VPIALTLEFLISADLSLADAESGSEKGFTNVDPPARIRRS
jgi:hypothetical protein